MTLVDAQRPEAEETAEKALRLPVGITSPLWLMIGGAAMVGAAVFWAKSWLVPAPVEVKAPKPKVLPKPEPEVEAALEKAAEAVVEAPAAVVEEVVEAVAEIAPEPEVVVDPVVEAPVVLAPDDLTVMTGIGPKMAAMLAEKGITRFAQIAAWSEDDIAGFDKELKLMGRVTREAWVAQAKRLAGG
jgi:predicted flap endonuclease-1-like 5' DNA nuclease